MANLFPTESLCLNYQPKPAPHFNPDRIVLTKGSFVTTQQRGEVLQQARHCRAMDQRRQIRIEADTAVSGEKWGYDTNTPLFLCSTGLIMLEFFLRNSLTLQCGFDVIGLEFHWSASKKVLKRAKIPFMKSNGKCQFKEIRTMEASRDALELSGKALRRRWSLTRVDDSIQASEEHVVHNCEAVWHLS
jgi:hypothetical protein